MACDVKSVKLSVIGLSCLQKLIAHDAVTPSAVKYILSTLKEVKFSLNMHSTSKHFIYKFSACISLSIYLCSMSAWSKKGILVLEAKLLGVHGLRWLYEHSYHTKFFIFFSSPMLLKFVMYNITIIGILDSDTIMLEHELEKHYFPSS